MRQIEFIYDRPAWPRLAWDDSALIGPLAAVRGRLGVLVGRFADLGFEPRSEAALQSLTAEVVASSEIEGDRLDAAEVRSSIARRLGLYAAGLPEASRRVEGVVEVAMDATMQAEEPLTRERLFGWHAALFPTGRSGTKLITVGAWRPDAAGRMRVVSGLYDRERVHFIAPEGVRLDSEMSAFLEWFNAPPTADGLLVAALAHLWFITLHPFDDGNGRLARAIADLALARATGAAGRFVSMSAQILAERGVYYDVLESAQRGDVDVTLWMAWFLGCLDRAVERSEASLESVLRKARIWRGVNARGAVNDRQRRVLNRMLGEFDGHMSTSKYARMAKCSKDTALRDLQGLVTLGALAPNAAGGRSTSYRLVELRP